MTFAGDMRLGVRSLAKTPGFTLMVVAVLAFGVGMTTALSSLIDQLLLWSVPGREPSRLVKIDGDYSRTYPFFLAYRDLNQVFEGVLASSDTQDAIIQPAGAPGVEIGRVAYVSGGYFQILGVGAAAGRVILPSDDEAGGNAVVVLSHRYWQRRFAGDPRVIGQMVSVNSYPLIIAGVAEKGFGGLFNGDDAEVFLPLAMYPAANPAASQAWNKAMNPWLTCVGRLRPGVSFGQAQASMPLLWERAVARVGDKAVTVLMKAHKLAQNEHRLAPAARDPLFIRNEKFLDPLKALAAATILVLLITCANVANLLLVRASERAKQTAVRLSLGASRGRLIRQFLTESMLLAAAGGVSGLGVAYFGVHALATFRLRNQDFRFEMSWFVLASCVGLTLATTILFGLMPALRATRINLPASIREHGTAKQMLSGSLLSRTLIAGQVALSLALLAAASLFGRTLRNLQNVDLGFQRQNIAIIDIDPGRSGYRDSGLPAFYNQLLDRTRSLSGVRAAALSGMTPIGNSFRSVKVATTGLREVFTSFFNPVSSGYFASLGIPLLAGRDFGPEDEPVPIPVVASGRWNLPRVCIIDQSLARKYFGTVDAVGRRYCFSDVPCSGDQGIVVVGVVKDVHYGEIPHADPLGTLYAPGWSTGPEPRWLVVRFDGSAAPVIASIRRALQDLDPNVPMLHVRLMEDYINRRLANERGIAYLAGFFAMLALTLAAVGLFGVLACVVAQRTHEIGIRMALGANRGDIASLILRFSLVPVIAGLLIGAVGALSWGIFLGTMFYGIDTFDVLSVAQAAAVLLAAALLAAAIPARRAANVDPMVALRYQ